MAPQILLQSSYNKSVDIWSCSVIMFMLFNNGQHPIFREKMKIQQYKKQLANYHRKPLQHNELAQNFLQRIQRCDPFQRYSANQALRHPWLTRRCEDIIPLSINQSFKGFQNNLKMHQLIVLSFLIFGNIMKTSKPAILTMKPSDYTNYRLKCQEFNKKSNLYLHNHNLTTKNNKDNNINNIKDNNDNNSRQNKSEANLNFNLKRKPIASSADHIKQLFGGYQIHTNNHIVNNTNNNICNSSSTTTTHTMTKKYTNPKIEQLNDIFTSLFEKKSMTTTIPNNPVAKIMENNSIEHYYSGLQKNNVEQIIQNAVKNENDNEKIFSENKCHNLNTTKTTPNTPNANKEFIDEFIKESVKERQDHRKIDIKNRKIFSKKKLRNEKSEFIHMSIDKNLINMINTEQPQPIKRDMSKNSTPNQNNLVNNNKQSNFLLQNKTNIKIKQVKKQKKQHLLLMRRLSFNNHHPNKK